MKKMAIHRHTAGPHGTPVGSCFYQIGSPEASPKTEKAARNGPGLKSGFCPLLLYVPHRSESLCFFLLGTTPSSDLTQRSTGHGPSSCRKNQIPCLCFAWWLWRVQLLSHTNNPAKERSSVKGKNGTCQSCGSLWVVSNTQGLLSSCSLSWSSSSCALLPWCCQVV
jgi:hypothetical protein